MSELKSISPLDGRYQNDVKDLSPIFSESALMKYRLIIEIEYLLALSHEPKIKEVREFNDEDRVNLRMIYEKFSEEEALKVKKIEKTTNHDVKSVEYYLKDKLKKINGLKDYLEFVYFALTSEDVNNLAYSLMLKDGVAVYLRSLRTLLKELKSLSWANKNVALLSLTHGQPASPTTVGKELAVFYYRLFRQLDVLSQILRPIRTRNQQQLKRQRPMELNQQSRRKNQRRLRLTAGWTGRLLAGFLLSPLAWNSTR